MHPESPEILTPDWPAPVSVRAAITTRLGGVSQAPFHHFNVAAHVGDNPKAVRKNRQLLAEHLLLPCEPQWLEQVHGIDVIDALSDSSVRCADGSYSCGAGRTCLVQTADCLPVLLCNAEGTEVAALHAGWRGLAAGIIAAGVDRFQPGELMAYLGPAISQAHFEVGSNVLQSFQRHAGEGVTSWGSLDEIDACFHQTDSAHWQADLYALARLALRSAGVEQIYGGQYCTYADQARFFSYRRDGKTGRMASLIWIE